MAKTAKLTLKRIRSLDQNLFIANKSGSISKKDYETIRNKLFKNYKYPGEKIK